MSVRQIKLEQVERVAFNVVERFMAWGEPLPSLSSRYPNVLESCLATPFQQFGGNDLYPTLLDKASMLFYLLIKNHPFENGNKRMAVATLLVFLYLNGKWLAATVDELYELARSVAETPPEDKDATMQRLRKFLTSELAPLKRGS